MQPGLQVFKVSQHPNWWRRRDSNPRPETVTLGVLRAQPSDLILPRFPPGKKLEKSFKFALACTPLKQRAHTSYLKSAPFLEPIANSKRASLLLIKQRGQDFRWRLFASLSFLRGLKPSARSSKNLLSPSKPFAPIRNFSNVKVRSFSCCFYKSGFIQTLLYQFKKTHVPYKRKCQNSFVASKDSQYYPIFTFLPSPSASPPAEFFSLLPVRQSQHACHTSSSPEQDQAPLSQKVL